MLIFFAVASTSHAMTPGLKNLVVDSEVRVWNVFHYYLGAKYFDELGYHDLYSASLAVDQENKNYWRSIERVRDLETYEILPRRLSKYDPEGRFTRERWQEFGRDVEALQIHRRPSAWSGIFVDRGYNPSPLWTAVGATLTSLFPATNLRALQFLCLLDLVLLGCTFIVLGRVFGWRVAALVLLCFSLSPVNEGRLVGGFLQYDWFCSFALGLCALRRQRPILSAGLLAYAAVTRIFPGILVISALVPLLAGWVVHGGLSPRWRRFFLAFCGFGLLGVGIGCTGGHGVQGWLEFADNIRSHSEHHRYGNRRIGLAHILTHPVFDVSFVEEGVSSRMRRENFSRQKAVYGWLAAGLLALWVASTCRRRGVDALLFGLLPLFVLAVSSRYYWSYLAFLPLLSRPGPAGRRRAEWIVIGQMVLLWAHYALGLEDRSPYAAYGVLEWMILGLLILMAGLYLRRDLQVWHRARS